MWIWFGLAFAAFGALSCAPDPTLVVGRNGRQVATPFCALESLPGPSGFRYCGYTEGAPVVGVRDFSWLSSPTIDSADFFVDSPDGAHVGLAFQLDPSAGVYDLSGNASLALDMDVSEGTDFELFLGRGPGVGCYYKKTRQADGHYVFDLRRADWCVPSQCRYNLQANGGLIIAKVQEASTLRARVRSISFAPGAAGDAPVAASATALGAGLGPGGLCWYLVNWGKGGLSMWNHQLGPSSASVTAKSNLDQTVDSVSGMAFELPGGMVLTDYSRIDVTAEVTLPPPGKSLPIQGVQNNRGLLWYAYPSDSASTVYPVNLLDTVDHFPHAQDPIAISNIERFEIVATSKGITDINVNVTNVVFVK